MATRILAPGGASPSANSVTTDDGATTIGIKFSNEARCVLVYRDEAGQIASRPVEHGMSVLNIERDLLIHLNEKPYSTEWLQVLRDYCDSRIEARRSARAGGAIVTPSPAFDWDMTSIAKKVGAA